MRAGAPGADGLLCIVVIGKIVFRHMDGQARSLVPQIFTLERVGVILRMPGDENLTAAVVGDGVDAGFLTFGKNLQPRGGQHLLPADGGVPGVGYQEGVVKAAEQDGIPVYHPVAEHTEELLWQRVFLQSIVVVQRRLGRPADVKGAVHMGLAPVKDGAQLVPVLHLLKVQLFHRRAGDDHAVEVPVLHLVKGFVEGQHVLLGGVARHMALHLEQLQLHLQGCVAQQPCQLGFGDDFGGHQVQKENLQRADFLRQGAALLHHEDILALQHLFRRQVVGNLDGHNAQPPLLIPQGPAADQPADPPLFPARRTAAAGCRRCPDAAAAPRARCHGSG